MFGFKVLWLGVLSVLVQCICIFVLDVFRLSDFLFILYRLGVFWIGELGFDMFRSKVFWFGMCAPCML